MDVLDAGAQQLLGFRRCHLWRWGPSPGPVEWERRALVVGGLSPLGLIAAGVSAAASAAGNRRRREAAFAAAAPGWRYVTSGLCRVLDGRLIVQEESGVARSFDLVDADRVESPAHGWLRVSYSGSDTPWALQVM